MKEEKEREIKKESLNDSAFKEDQESDPNMEEDTE